MWSLCFQKRYVKDEVAFREFKLTAIIKKDIHLSKQDIEQIRAKRGGII